MKSQAKQLDVKTLYRNLVYSVYCKPILITFEGYIMFIFTLPSLGKAQRVREELSSLQYGIDYKISIGELSLPSDFPMLDMLIYKCDLG